MKLSYFVVGLFLIEIDSIISSGDIKSSLTFVIDDTGSMEEDICEVKTGAKAILDTVRNSNATQIEDYVLVTINDPTFELRKATKDADEFKEVLDSLNIKTGSGYSDCPEMSMSGIELALQSSREGSSLYVFTDASAKDYQKYDQVEALSQKMGCQIIFVLTGSCTVTGGRTAPQYLVYQRLATATNGQVFHLEKYEVGKILDYVKYNVESRKNILASKTFPGGRGTFNINVDADTKELVISVSGENPSVSVTDSQGAIVPITGVTRLIEVAVVKVVAVKPDVYEVEVGGSDESTTHVVVSGSTSVHFQHGFSTVRPSAITDTVRRPVPGEKSYLAIKLATEREVELRSVQILDMKDTVVLEKPLILVDEAETFYTTEQMDPPDEMFKIAIKVYDVNSQTHLTRISLTPVKPQKLNMDTAKIKAPKVDCNTNIIATFDKPLQLKCKVSGYPKPLVTWESEDKSAVLSHLESTVELPYDYISVLDIRIVKNNATYSCKAVNSAGDDSKRIMVITNIPNYFRTLELPKDITIEYQKSGQIPCKVEAYPPVTITWYRGGIPIRINENFELAADRSVLFIRSMNLYMADNYLCEAVSSERREVFKFKVSISGIEAPVINKQISSITTVIGSSAAIQCQIIKGTPAPTFHWKHKRVAAYQFTYMRGITDTIHFDKVETSNAGTYRCSAENNMGLDNHDIELIVEYKPLISNSLDRNMTVNEGDMVTLPCRANGVPDPSITWKFNGDTIKSTAWHSISIDGTLRFPATSSDEGGYECEAKNSHGVDKINIQLNIKVPVDIESPIDSVIQHMEGLPLDLPCRAYGSPNPSISWYYHNKYSNTGPTKYEPSDDTGELHFDSLQPSQSGEYTCVATNPKGSKNITYDVSVLALPSINTTTKEFRGVVNDMQLKIPCQATGNPKPVITWMAKGLPIASGSDRYYISRDGTLTIKNIDKGSEGVYECKALNKYGETKENFNVIVNESPDPGFLSDVKVLKEGDSVTIPCRVLKKQTDRLQWFKDGHLISSSALELRNVTEKHAGTYVCRVSSIDRPAQDASIKVEVGFKPHFTLDSASNIPFIAGKKAVMDCSAKGIPEPEVAWYHDGEEIHFNDYKYELQMKDGKEAGVYICVVSNVHGTLQRDFIVSTVDKKPTVIETSDRCNKGNANISKVGFEINGVFQEVYKVCLDKVSKRTIYTKLNMQPPLGDFNNDTPVDLDGLYDCKTQNEQIRNILNRGFQRNECCFKQRMLVNPADVAPGLAQVTTYAHLNVAPHWSTCNSQNWEAVERRIRYLVNKINRPLLVWTGTAEELQLPDARSEQRSIVLTDRNGNIVQVPRYYWKVVQDLQSSASLAIIQVNVPDLKAYEVFSHYMRCTDVSNTTKWMRAGSWRNPTFGYTYCCNLEEFERAFGYDGEFSSYYNLLVDD